VHHIFEKNFCAAALAAQKFLANLAPVPPETQQQWDAYFAEVQAINSQPDFPWTFEWPTPPHIVKRIKATVERI